MKDRVFFIPLPHFVYNDLILRKFCGIKTHYNPAVFFISTLIYIFPAELKNKEKKQRVYVPPPPKPEDELIGNIKSRLTGNIIFCELLLKLIQVIRTLLLLESSRSSLNRELRLSLGTKPTTLSIYIFLTFTIPLYHFKLVLTKFSLSLSGYIIALSNKKF